MSIEISVPQTTSIVYPFTPANQNILDRAQQVAIRRGLTFKVNGERVSVTARCAKCQCAVTETFDLTDDHERTLRALRFTFDKLTPHSVPLHCVSCRPPLSLIQYQAQPRSGSGSTGGNGGGGGRKPKPRQSKPKGQRRMTFSMAIEIAGGYGFILVRQGHGYAAKPRTGGTWTPYTTLNDALAAIEAVVVASRKAR